MKKNLALLLTCTLFLLLISGCTSSSKMPSLDPNNPITLEVWHYYNGPQKTAFDDMVTEFNDTVGLEQGIVVEAFSQGNVQALSEKVLSSAQQLVGSEPLPHIFATYADTAYEVDKLGMLTQLDSYFTQEELDAYRPEFIEEGRFSSDDSLRIFPIAKSVELMMLNLTDWDKFANATGAQLSDLSTIEGITRTAQAYYQWTDSLTLEPNDGKAFFGRDAMANYMIIGCRQLGLELFQINSDGTVSIHTDAAVLRKLWDNYYVPYVNGWFSSNGRFRSDEAKLGDIIALVGSSSATAYFPTKVSISDFQDYDIESLILPAPQFEDSEHYAIQQGAGMAVTKSDPEHEYASAVFLKWFTDSARNTAFAAASGGYLPVKKDALNLDSISAALISSGDGQMTQTFSAALEELSNNTMYTPPPFSGNIDARSVLESSINSVAKSDRESILALIAQGTAPSAAVALYNTDANFDAWLSQLTSDLEHAVSAPKS